MTMHSLTLMTMARMHLGRAEVEGAGRGVEGAAEEGGDPGVEERGEGVDEGGALAEAGEEKLASCQMRVRAQSRTPSHKARRKKPTIITWGEYIISYMPFFLICIFLCTNSILQYVQCFLKELKFNTCRSGTTKYDLVMLQKK